MWRWLCSPSGDYLATIANGLICAAAVMIRYEMVAWAAAVTLVTLLGSFLPQPDGPSVSARARATRRSDASRAGWRPMSAIRRNGAWGGTLQRQDPSALRRRSPK